MEQYIPSKLLSNAVDQFAKLPGVGRRTALRLVLELLKRDENSVTAFANSITELKQNIRTCKICGNLSDSETCSICTNHSRNHSLVCVVENVRDIIAIEQTGTYRGTYHVLGGLISPMDGIGPSELNISSLTQRIEQGGIDEIIFALSANMEGDTTCFYLSRLISGKGIKISQIARGVAFGGDLEYTDEITLSRSIENRTEYGGNL
ncbi:MAG: recombination mediator RecR [Bacteroidales bacterium]|nr:recombination mediator RecR [Bacteroidales bacterium]